jgi:serine/threonine protein kinase
VAIARANSVYWRKTTDLKDSLIALGPENMQEVMAEVARYIAGTTTGDELRDAIRVFLAHHPDRRIDLCNWFQTGIKDGRLSPGLGDLLRDYLGSVTLALTVQPSTPAADSDHTQLRHDEPASAVVPPAQDALHIGMVLLNRYRLIDQLGRGGMGQVFKAVDQYLEGGGKRNPYIALKALDAAYISDASARDGLLEEAMRAKSLSHDNIVRVDNFEVDGPYIFITMEYLQGRSLDALMGADHGAGWSIDAAWPIIEKVGQALEYAHGKGVVHSDVKPSNIFITQKNLVKVVDFGISRLMARTAQNITVTQYRPDSVPLGITVAYASLEQWLGEPPDPRDDVYAFALVVYELLTGHHPFAGARSLDAYASGLQPKRIDSLTRPQWEALRAALALPRAQRTKSVALFLRAFAPVAMVRRYGLAIGAGALMLVATAIALGSREYSNHVEQQMLCAGVPKPQRTSLTPDKRKEIEDSLFLADDFLRDVNPDLEPRELAYLLSEGANNVNQIVRGVLDLDADNARALEMKSKIAALYLRKAQELRAKRQTAQALEMIRDGMKVSCDDLNLFHLQREICESDAPLCARS